MTIDDETIPGRATPEQTWMNNWPEALWKLTFPGHRVVEVDEVALHAMLSLAYGVEVGKDLEVLKSKITKAMAGRPWFVRLNSRSPKDYRNPPIASTADDVVEFLTCSLRTTNDMGEMYVFKKPCSIYFRVPLPFDTSREFSCFVKGGELIAITQYDGTLSRFPVEHKDRIVSSLRTYSERVIAAFPFKEFVFDVFFTEDLNPCLIEVNPYGLSNPCFFYTYEAVERGGYAYAAQTIEPLDGGAP